MPYRRVSILSRLPERLGPRALCLLLAGSMGCAAAQPERWHASDEGPGFLDEPPRRQAQAIRTWGSPRDPLASAVDPLISPGFLLSLRCPDDEKLNGDFRVDFDGELALPYEVTLNTNGATLSALKRRLAKLYRPYFRTDSGLELRVKQQRLWVDVRGLVEKPGRYLAEPDASLDSVIGLAGGLGKDPAPLYVRIQKGRKTLVCDLRRYYSQGGDDARILGWLGGEVLFFQRGLVAGTETASLAGLRDALGPGYREQVTLLGEIRKPGEYTLDPGTDLADSIVQAGGFTDRADWERIDVIRQAGGSRMVRRYTWNDVGTVPAPSLQRGDVVMVYADRTPKAERRATLWLGVGTTLAAILTSVILMLSYSKGRI